MADVQKEYGYTKIPIMLYTNYCVMARCLSGYQHSIFLVVVRHTMGRQREQNWISLSQLSEMTGIPEQHVSRVINTLIEYKMIIKNGKKIQVQTDYIKWRWPHRAVRNKQKRFMSGFRHKEGETVCPTVEDGFIMIAHDLLEKYVKISRHLSMYKNAVFLETLRLTYGFHKTKAKLYLTSISKDMGISVQHLCHAKKKLLKYNMLIEEDGEYGIQKDYLKWKIPVRATATRPRGTFIFMGKDALPAKSKSNYNRVMKFLKEYPRVCYGVPAEEMSSETLKMILPYSNGTSDDIQWESRVFLKWLKERKEMINVPK